MSKAGEIRLYVDEALGAGQEIALNRDQSHYLFAVMRRSVGADLRLFNGRDGEWRATVLRAGKTGQVVCAERLRAQVGVPDIWLMFAPVKKARMDFIVEKAVELGVSRITPVFTEFTNAARIRTDRMAKIAIQAAEQSEGLNLPRLDAGMKLDAAIKKLGVDRKILMLNENERVSGVEILSDLSLPVALLVGPEGGFSASEISRLTAMERVCSISLGPRILRADTAVVAGLSLIQAHLGDWR